VALVFDRGLWMVAGVAIGGAAEDVLRPILEPAAQTAWANRPFKVLDAGTAAMIRARNAQPGYGGIDLQGVDLTDDARRGGLGTARFYLETEAARTWPGVAQLINLRRRRLAFGGEAGISQGDFRDGLRRQGFRTEAIDYLTDLLVEHLDVADIANAIQQGFLPNDGILPATTPPAPGWQHSDGPFAIPVEQIPIDPTNEAAYHGLDPAHLKVLAELVGLPPGEETLLDLWRRGIIDGDGYAAGLREGHTKTKWTAALSARFFQLLNPATLVNLRLRGYIEDPEYHDRMRLHGYRAEQANDWFLSAGRPLAPQQMLDLIARKGPGPGGGVFSFADFRQGMVESDIKPKYAAPAQALYHKYPSLFQLRRAVTDGGMSRQRALDILAIERYEDRDAATLVTSWLAPTATGAKGLTAAELTAEYEGLYLTDDEYVADLVELGYSREHALEKARVVDAKRVKKARDAVVARARSEYVRHRISRAAAQAALVAEGVREPAQDLLLGEWDHERELTADALTAAQIRKAYRSDIIDRQTALDRLQRVGYDPGDDAIYLDA
jgi:hypothetical protein